jgi:hypothetical protein
MIWRVADDELDEAWPVLQRLAPPQIEGHNVGIEEVRRQIEQGVASLFASDEGYLLLAIDGLDLVIWCAVATSGHADIAKYLGEIERIAAYIGAKRIVMRSPRIGWLRRLPQRWKVVDVTYCLEVGDAKEQGHRSGN